MITNICLILLYNLQLSVSCLLHPSLEDCLEGVEDGELSLLNIIFISVYTYIFVSFFIRKMEISRLDPAILGFKTCETIWLQVRLSMSFLSSFCLFLCSADLSTDV